MKKIENFHDFITELNQAGMTMGGENNEGIFSLCSSFQDSVRWHTEDQETDPWEWRMRVLNECDDIAYGKFFFKKSGYITKEWYPYFYAVRRNKTELLEAYEAGTISHYGKRIYGLLEEYKELPLHLIKQYGDFTKEDRSRFDSAITELQMKFYITMCGKARKISKKGEAYGWNSTVFCLTEDFFPEEVIEKAAELKYQDAYNKIEAHIYKLNPEANPKKVKKFITG